MTDPGLRLEHQHHYDLEGFDSGNAELDGWLRRHALAAQHMDSARTFLLTERGPTIGYFGLTMGFVREEAPRRLIH